MIKATEMLFEWDFRFLDFNCNEFESINIVKNKIFTSIKVDTKIEYDKKYKDRCKQIQ